MSDQLFELVGRLKGLGKEHVTIQTAWGKVQEIDWNEKTCTVLGLSDDVPYYDVLLGLGAVQVKPIVGSMALVGIVENQDAQAFLIEAEEVEEYYLKVTGKVSVSNDEESLADLMVDLVEEILKMKFTTNSGPTIKLINSPKFESIKTRFKSLLK